VALKYIAKMGTKMANTMLAAENIHEVGGIMATKYESYTKAASKTAPLIDDKKPP